MRVYLGADHRGFELKKALGEWLKLAGFEVVDVGAHEFIPSDDYVDYVREVLEKMDFKEDRAVMICGSGHGMDLALNRHSKMRAVLGFNRTVAKQGRLHENANALVLPSDWISEEEAKQAVSIFLKTKFTEEERHVRRLKKVESLV